VVGEEAVDAELQEALHLAGHVSAGAGIEAAPAARRQVAVLGTQRPRVHPQPGGVSVPHEGRGDEAFLDPDCAGVARDVDKPVAPDHLGVGAREAPRGEVPRAPLRVDELDQRELRLARELPQVADLEGLDEDRRVRAIEAVASQGGEQRRLQRQPQRGEVGRVLRLGVDADRPACRGDERQHLVEGRDPEAAIEGRPAQLREPLAGAQRLELRDREILGEPAIDRVAVDQAPRAAGSELGTAGNVRRPGDLVLVAADEDAVLRGDEIRLDEVGALLDRQPVRLERVLGPVATRAAVGDHDRAPWRRR
jgi:hypothetical protein